MRYKLVPHDGTCIDCAFYHDQHNNLCGKYTSGIKGPNCIKDGNRFNMFIAINPILNKQIKVL